MTIHHNIQDMGLKWVIPKFSQIVLKFIWKPTILNHFLLPWFPLQSKRQFFSLFSSQSGTLIGFSWIRIKFEKSFHFYKKTYQVIGTSGVQTGTEQVNERIHWQIPDNSHSKMYHQSNKNHFVHKMRDNNPLDMLHNNLDDYLSSI